MKWRWGLNRSEDPIAAARRHTNLEYSSNLCRPTECLKENNQYEQKHYFLLTQNRR